jgi:hypothetical protein
MEEIYMRGPLGSTDIRIINSYPNKVARCLAKVEKSVTKVETSRESVRGRALSSSAVRMVCPNGLETTSFPAAW